MSASKPFDAVIVGSGFGGSVMAFRLASGGLNVCLLERGKRWPPGTFPRTPLEFERALWAPDRGLHGLYDVWSFGGMGALISSGLGGGSLIYANVLLRKDEAWFDESGENGGYEARWPVGRADLDPHYDAVEQMLRPELYPYADRTPKAIAFRKAAADAGLDEVDAPLAVTFGEELGPPGVPFDKPENNLHLAQRYTCRLVGECDVGCNSGSKNSLDYTYLTHAQRAGADIRCRHEVKAFKPTVGGYNVEFVDYSGVDGAEPESIPEPQVLFGRRLILAAGALGTPYLLLKNASCLRDLSPRLGERFSGNGDFLTFAARSSEVLEPAIGTVITSAIRVSDRRDSPPGVASGHYIQDGGYPAFLAWFAEAMNLPRIEWAQRHRLLALAWRWLTGHRQRNLSYDLSEMIGDQRSTAGTLPLLGMGLEPAQGKLKLGEDGRLDLDWSFERAEPYFDHVRETMATIAEALGARIEDNILRRLSAVVTVHPVGGCAMGTTAADGVVDPANGQVHNNPGLYVADGSVMPGPVGPNPSLTIAALADRFASAILEEASDEPG